MNQKPNLHFDSKHLSPPFSTHHRVLPFQSMDSTTPACSPQTHGGGGGGLIRSIAKLVRLRRAATAKCKAVDRITTTTIFKPKLPAELELYDGSSVFSQPGDDPAAVEDEKGKQQSWQREAMETLLAGVFAGVSAIKASYAELQLAQSPYDPEAIEAADHAIVAELKGLSQVKHLHLTKGYAPLLTPESSAFAQAREQRNLIKTFQITIRKLESDLQRRDDEAHSLRQRLHELTEENRSLESKLRARTAPSGLDDLRFSDLNATHFVLALQHATRAVRAFVRRLEREMEAAEWDLREAAETIAPAVARGREPHRSLAFESFVCRVMFDGFHHRHFGLLLRPPPVHEHRSGFFREFLELKAAPLEDLLRQPALGCFLGAKYETLVHPEMERAFFGGVEQREVLGSGEGYPKTGFFASFAEMARRVWALHRLFWSFEEGAAEVFVAAAGTRFSEVYMASAAAEDDGEAAATVGFAVVPGFRVGGVVVQCRVYLARGKRGNGRP